MSPLTVDDRSFLYGDGLFETLLVHSGCLLWPELHIDRLMLGCERLRIPLSRQDVEAMLPTRFDRDAGIVRLSVSRGRGPRGYAPSESATPIIRVSEYPAPSSSALRPVDLVFSSVRLATQPLLAGIKHCNRLEQVLAADDATRRGADDAILLGEDGNVQCAVSANVFAVIGRTLITPPVERAGVSGTRRRLILERLASTAGLEARVEPLSTAACEEADAVLLSNTGSGIRQAQRLEGVDFTTDGPVFLALRDAYRREIERCRAL